MAKKRTARRLKASRRDTYIAFAMDRMRHSEPTMFRFEAALRTGFRQKFCLAGWHWHDADDAAFEIVETALRRLGAVRPTWQQGQSDYVRDGAMFTTLMLTRCVHCGKALEEDRWRFCSDLCAGVVHKRHQAVAHAEDERILREIIDAA